MVLGVDSDGQTALRPPGAAVAEVGAGHESDAAGRGQPKRSGEPGNAGADHDDVDVDLSAPGHCPAPEAPISIILVTAARARWATSGRMVTSSRLVRRHSTSRSGVIIFMNRQEAFGFTGTNCVLGRAWRSWWSMSTSVATRVSRLSLSRARSSMPDVDVTCTRSVGSTPAPAAQTADVAHPHSGWISSSASG